MTLFLPYLLGRKKPKTSSCFLLNIFLSKEHTKFTRLRNLLKSTQCLSKGKHFILKDEFMNWKKMAFSFQVLEALRKQGNKVIEMIKGAYASKKWNFGLL